MTDRPDFRFHPRAYDRVFKASEQVCDVCELPAVWLYAGSIYTEFEQPAVCARCIADGSLADHLGDFQFFDAELQGTSEELADEVLRRTPGFDTYNPFEWPVEDGAPLAFMGYGDTDNLWRIPAARAAIEQSFDYPAPMALVFRTLDGARWRIVVDPD